MMFAKQSRRPSRVRISPQCSRLSALASLVLTACFSVNAVALDLSPFFSWDFRADGALTWSALGPLFENRKVEFPAAYDTLLAAPRPLFVYFARDENSSAGFDAAWPLAFGRRRPDSSYQYALLFLHTKRFSGGSQSERWYLLPLLYYGRDREGESYFGFFPLGGGVRDIAGLDRVQFWLWPLYVSTAHGQTVSHSVLWPIFSRTTGPRTHKWRVFPLSGVAETPAKTRRFILWPFGHTVNDHPPDAPWQGSGWFIFPLFGLYRLQDDSGEPIGSAWTLLWPLFSRRTSPAGSMLNAPWPFFQTARGVTAGGEVAKLYFWPFYGRKIRPDHDYRFVMWPLYNRSATRYADTRYESRSIVPFYYSTARVGEDQATAVRRLCWPLFRHERRENGDAWLRAPALWPLPAGEPVLRDYAPLWQLYRYNRQDEVRSHSFLWGLWQHQRRRPDMRSVTFNPLFDYRRDGADRSCSILKGLAAWGQLDGENTGRVLWFIDW